MVQLMKNYVTRRGAWIDRTLLNDSQIPATPSVRYTGPENFPSPQLRFRASAYQGAGAFAAMKWRLAEITPTNAPMATPRAPRRYEITPVWQSADLETGPETIAIPGGIAKPGHTYRVRVRMKDVTGRWSHWSSPAEFVAGP